MSSMCGLEVVEATGVVLLLHECVTCPSRRKTVLREPKTCSADVLERERYVDM